MKNLTGESMNITEENLKAMQQLFPEAFEEGKIDFDVLRQLLGDFVDDEQERYSFKWNGKGKALRLSQTPSIGTLRPCKEESKDWDNTENLYIEGDNLEVLKLLQKSYYGKVKMIYIDPPYNTGNDFVYKDDFHDNIQNYKEITGQVDGEGNKIDTNTESNGRFHTDWLNMMYPRLRLARNLLTDDGVIFISIDDNEQENLKRICDEVFGENNFVCLLTVKMSHLSGMKMSHIDKKIPKIKEFIYLYSKSYENIKINPVYIPGEWEKVMDRYSGYIENFDCDISKWERVPLSKKCKDMSEKEALNFKISNADKIFRTAVNDTLSSMPKDNIFRKVVTKTGLEKYVYNAEEVLFASSKMKIFDGRLLPADTIGDIWTDIGINNLHNEGGVPFPNGKKPIRLIKRLMETVVGDDSIVLDFFSGSATTAHAVMQLNSEDGGNRKFVLIQLPETADEKSEPFKAGFKNICEVGKERIRRAGDKIKAEAGDKADDLDIGFKVFKLDSSNLQKWNPQPDDLVMTLQQATDNFLPDRTEQDVLYEIMLKMGLELTCQIEEEQAAGETVYIIGGGALMICLGRNITTAVAEAVVKLHEEYESELWQVVFRDTGFASDMDKTNVKETLKAAGLDEDSFVCV